MGFGCLFSSLPVATQAPQSQAHMAVASALSPFFRAIGQSFGIAISDSIYQNTLKSHLSSASSDFLQKYASDIAKSSASLVAILQNTTQVSIDTGELLQSFNHSLHMVWWAFVGISLLGGISSLFIREISLDQRKSTEGGPSQADPEKGASMAADTSGETPATTGGHKDTRVMDDTKDASESAHRKPEAMPQA